MTRNDTYVVINVVTAPTLVFLILHEVRSLVQYELYYIMQIQYHSAKHSNELCVNYDSMTLYTKTSVYIHKPNQATWFHYNDVIMGAMASQITGLMVVYSTVYSGTDQRKHQSSASLALVRGIHRWPVATTTLVSFAGNLSHHRFLYSPISRTTFPKFICAANWSNSPSQTSFSYTVKF